MLSFTDTERESARKTFWVGAVGADPRKASSVGTRRLIAAVVVTHPQSCHLVLVGCAPFENRHAVATWVQIGNLEDHLCAGGIRTAVKIVIFDHVRHIDAVVNHIQIFMRGVVAGHPGCGIGTGFIIQRIIVSDFEGHILVDTQAKVTQVPDSVSVVKIIERPCSDHIPIIQFHAVCIVLVGSKIHLESALIGLRCGQSADDHAADTPGVVLHVGKPEVVAFTDIQGEGTREALWVGAVGADP